jgi:hydroxymethylbilane synthase
VSCSIEITVGARGSHLSRVQCDEVLQELRQHHPHVLFHPIWVETTGDKDLKTSLRTLDKTDFFTKEIDQLQLAGQCRIGIHSAKDLPDPLPRGLVLAALTKGVDPSDSLVLQNGATLQTLPQKARIGTSSARRDQNIRALRPDLICVDIRGTIQARLDLLDRGVVDGLVIAEAALIRLKLTDRTRLPLPGERAPLQGQLAIIALEKDAEMEQLFACIDTRQK